MGIVAFALAALKCGLATSQTPLVWHLDVLGAVTVTASSMLAMAADPVAALNGGYHVAFAMGAMCAVAAAVLCAVLLPAGSADKLSAPESAGVP